MLVNMKNDLKNCHDCGTKPGYPHMPFCDVERCSVCGGQRISCECKGHDPSFARWTGLWPVHRMELHRNFFVKPTKENDKIL
jgi:hypothetical protein